MDSKFYVSYKVARLLKEKGYTKALEDFDFVYLKDGSLSPRVFLHTSPFIAAPTKAEAIAWLESKGIVVVLGRVTPIYVGHAGEKEWSFDLELKESGKFNGCLRFKTRLEAEEEAIIQACELL